VSPLATLDRGYAILFDAKSGKVLRSAAAATPGQSLLGKLADGELTLFVRP
jgi:exodeoxyribonuclease VII large subunit